MELTKWFVHWTLNLSSRVRYSPKTMYMIYRMMPGKTAVRQKSEVCMTKLYVLAHAHVLRCSRAPPPTFQVNLNN